MDRLPHSIDRTLLCHCAVKLAAQGLCGQASQNRLLFATKVEGHDVGKCRQVGCHVSRDRERFPPRFVCSEPENVTVPLNSAQASGSFRIAGGRLLNRLDAPNAYGSCSNLQMISLDETEPCR